MGRCPALLLALAGCADAPGPDPSTPGPRHLLMVTVDTLRADHVGAIGSERDTTPRIDRLAARGAVFTQAIAQSSWTRPSMASVFSGLYPTTVGLTCHNFRYPQLGCDILAQDVTTLAELLAGHGHRTAAVVANINVDALFGFDQGFGELRLIPSERAGEDRYWRLREAHLSGTTTAVTEAALSWLRARAGDPAPFFLYLHYLDPHQPYEPPEEHGVFDPDGYSVPADIREAIARYDGEIRYVDEELGRVLSLLESTGLAADTAVVVLSDHGEEFRDHGGTQHGRSLYDEQLRVPLVMVVPGVTRPGTRVDTQVRLLDLMPTLLEVFGIAAPANLQGRSLLPLMRGEELDPLPALAEWGYTPHVAWRAPPWKLILDTETGTTELYDLERDPGEREDLSARHPEVVRELLAQLRSVRERARQAGEVFESASGEVTLTPAQTEQLRELGYLMGYTEGEPPSGEAGDPR